MASRTAPRMVLVAVVLAMEFVSSIVTVVLSVMQ
jgi:hypothetical protein